MAGNTHTITRLSAQKRPSKVKLYLDETYAFSVLVDIVLQHHLAVGKGYAADQLTSILNQSLSLEDYQQAVAYTQRRPRSIQEVQIYLTQKLRKQTNQYQANAFYDRTTLVTKPTTLINQIITKLVTQNHLDDVMFAQWWVEQRLRFRPRGKQALQYELRQKGVDDSIITAVLAAVDAQNPVYTQQLTDLLAKEYTAIRKKITDRRKLKQRLCQRLLSKGYRWDEFASQIDEYLAKEYNDLHAE